MSANSSPNIIDEEYEDPVKYTCRLDDEMRITNEHIPRKFVDRMMLISILTCLAQISALPSTGSTPVGHKRVHGCTDSDECCATEFIEWMSGPAMETHSRRLREDPLVQSIAAIKIPSLLVELFHLSVSDAQESCVFASQDTRPSRSQRAIYNSVNKGEPLFVPYDELKFRYYYYMICDSDQFMHFEERLVYAGRSDSSRLSSDQTPTKNRSTCYCRKRILFMRLDTRPAVESIRVKDSIADRLRKRKWAVTQESSE